jgi:isovaleryl-CoA dehydrogenase
MTHDDPRTLFDPTDEHRMLRQMVRDFARNEVEPQAEEQDAKGGLNRALFAKTAELGLLGITVPGEEGGAGLDSTGAVIVHHELSKSDPGFCLAYLAHTILFVNNFYYASNAEQKARYLDKVTSGEWVGAMGMTEPGAGTDVLGMTSTATPVDDGFRLNGTKTFITNGTEADVAIIYAKVDGRITSFVVEAASPGYSRSQPIKKMGMRASSMAELNFEDVFVPTENVLGEVGGGLVHMMRNLEIERLTLAAMSLGIADRCVDTMVRYANERRAFGEPINRFGQIQRYIGESFAKTEAMRCLIYQVARSVTPTTRNRVGTDAAKLFAATAAKEVADNAMQVLGGWGYCTEFVVERLLRDAKLLEIGGGTIESHQKNLTKDLTAEIR